MECTVIASRSNILREKKVEYCPYRNVSSNVCAASLFNMKIDTEQLSIYCSADRFSDCALFLSKTLRTR